MNFLKKVIYLLLCFQFFHANLTEAQKKELKFEHLTIEDGLSNSIVIDIFKDSKGYMWFTTVNGLNRYDGYEFKKFFNDLKDPTTIAANRICCIMEDNDGEMIVSTWNAGLSVYNSKTGRFVNYVNQPGNPKSLPVNVLRKVLKDKSGEIWIATIGAGLVHFDKKKQEFKSFSPPKYQGSRQINSITLSHDGQIIVPFNEEGIFSFNPLTEKFTRLIDNAPNHNINNSISAKYVTQTSDYKLWIGTEGDGAYLYDPVTQTSRHFLENPLEPGSIGSNVVRDIIEDNTGEIWLATDGGGLNHYIPETGKFERHLSDLSNPNSLSTNQLYRLYLDKSGILWIGTFSGGLNIYNPAKEKFKVFKPKFDDPKSLSYKSVLSIIEDKEQKIWIGTDGGGVSIFDPEQPENGFTHLKNDFQNPNSLVSNIVKSVYQDKVGNFWFGTYQHGLDKYNPLTKKFVHFGANGSPTGLPTGLIWAIFEDSFGNFWISSLGGGIVKMNRDKQSFKTYRPSSMAGSISQVNIMVIIEDSKRRVWFGTEGGGLNRYNPELDNFSIFRYDRNNPNSLSSDDVRAIYEDKKGNLWIGTDGGGLNLLSPDLKTFKHFTIDDGLPSNVIYGILEDDSSNLWLSTAIGLSKFNPEKKTFRNYDKLDGLQSNEFTYTAACKTKDGKMLFGGIEGFNMFRPEEIKDNLTIPPVYITELLIFNKTVTPGDKHKIMDVPIDQLQEVHIPYEYSVITLRFTALNYTHTSKNKYSYILDNFEKKWNNVVSKREATYTNLDPGTYIFRVRACNNDGIWNMEGTTLKIIIDPPWYYTIWAKIIYLLVILLMLYLLVRYIINLFKKQKLKLENEKKQKLLIQQKKFEEEAMQAEKEILELKNQRLLHELFVLEQEKKYNEKSEQLKQEQLKAEKEILKLKQEKLENEISYKSNELASLALHFSHKNEILIAIKEDMEKLSIDNLDESVNLVKKTLKSIQDDLELDDNWHQFELHFDEVHQDFLKRFKEKYPDLKPMYLKLCAYIRMKLTSKQIAALTNTSLASVEKNRYRLREKLSLEEGIKLTDFIEKF